MRPRACHAFQHDLHVERGAAFKAYVVCVLQNLFGYASFIVTVPSQTVWLPGVRRHKYRAATQRCRHLFDGTRSCEEVKRAWQLPRFRGCSTAWTRHERDKAVRKVAARSAFTSSLPQSVAVSSVRAAGRVRQIKLSRRIHHTKWKFGARV